MTGQMTGDFHLQASDGHVTTRDYEVLVPSTYDPATPLALTFAFHGANANEAAAKAFGLQNAPGAAAASIFVFPQGVSQGGTIGWDVSPNGTDMTFVDNMIAYLEGHYCIRLNAVFAAGFSWGCDFITALTCTQGPRLRAIGAASCSGDYNNPADYTTFYNEPCVGHPTTGIRFTHDANGDPYYSLQDFTTTSALYRSFNACSTTSSPTAPSPPCVAYQGCAEPFIECPYQSLGHTLPSNWGTDTWNFFATFH
jgi:poly(3-hydroxybutyrate) depolymerase